MWTVSRFMATAVVFCLAIGRTYSANLPSGFTESTVASGLQGPTGMEFAPDGRLFVCEQVGRLRIIKNGVLLPAPFLTISVNSSGELGLLGVAFDPSFAINQYVYVVYSVNASPLPFHRISRFTANGDLAVPGSEVILFNMDPLTTVAANYAAIQFGLDGKLYATVGKDINGNAQLMTTVLGKMLRLNPDGTIPTDNPFYGSASGKNRAIFALGLRNPFTLAVHPITGRIFVNDVGETVWEEVNEAIAGANYGWPLVEGPTTDPRFRAPIFAYQHGTSSPAQGCAVAGGAFYAPAVNQFPAQYSGQYFFADWCNGWIRTLNPTTNAVSPFATGLTQPISIKVGPDGSLYYLNRGDYFGSVPGSVLRISYSANQAPQISAHPASQTVLAGQTASFSVSATGNSPLSYQWFRSGSPIAGASAATYVTPATTVADSGAQFYCVVTNSLGSATSNTATLTVNSPPSTGVNLLIDPGFESNGAGWQKSTSGGRSVVTTQAHSGTRSQQMIASAAFPREVFADVNIVAGSYDIAGWILTSGISAGARIELQWLNAAGLTDEPPAGNIVRTDVLGPVTGSGAWTRLAGTFSAPASAVVARVRLITAAEPDGAGTAWFDDMHLSRASGTPNAAPTGTITAPAAGTSYTAGTTISYGGTGADSEDGVLPASAFTWQIDFHHDTHAHPFIPATSGSRTGSFTIPATGHTETNVWYRIRLQVRDSGGLTHSSFVDIFPRLSMLTLQTNPAGLQVRLDGQPQTAPFTAASVVGIIRTIEVVSPQVLGGTSYQFSAWSDGGAAQHTIVTPGTNTSYVATFTAGGGGGGTTNLLSDPGFESNGQGWLKSTSGGRAVVTTQAHSGLRSQQMSAYSLYPREVYQDITVTAGSTYSASAWVMTSGLSAGSTVSVMWLNATGLDDNPPASAIIRTDVLGTVTGTQPWTALSGTYTAPATARIARFRLYTLAEPDGAGTAWFDDAQFR